MNCLDKRSLLACTALLLIGILSRVTAAEWSVKVVDKPPPAALGESFTKLLQPRALQLLEDDQPQLEFWFPAQWSLGKPHDASSKGLGSLTDATVLGAAVVHKDRRDYRDDELYAGTYTMRFGTRPNDGNHLGTSEFLYFAVLTPAKLDTAVDQIKTYKQLVKASSQETATDHPFILSLRPGTTDSGEFPRLNEPAEAHRSILIKRPAVFEGAKSTVIVDLVFEGVAEH